MEQEQKKQEIEKQINIIDRLKNNLYIRINEFNKEEQELIKHLDNLEQQKKEKYKNHLEGFDEEFETHTQLRIKETPLLLALFNEFVQEIYRPSEMYKLAAKTKNIINDELLILQDNSASRIDFEVLAKLCYSLDCKVEDIIEYVPYKNSKEQ